MGQKNEVVVYSRQWVNTGLRFSLVEFLGLGLVLILMLAVARYSWQERQVQAAELKMLHGVEELRVSLDRFYDNHECYPDKLEEICGDNRGSRGIYCDDGLVDEIEYRVFGCGRYWLGGGLKVVVSE